MKKGIYLLLLSISIHFLANAQDNAGLALPTGFKANLFAENILEPSRHILGCSCRYGVFSYRGAE